MINWEIAATGPVLFSELLSVITGLAIEFSRLILKDLPPLGMGVRSSLELHGHYEAIVATLNEGVNNTSRLAYIYSM